MKLFLPALLPPLYLPTLCVSVLRKSAYAEHHIFNPKKNIVSYAFKITMGYVKARALSAEVWEMRSYEGLSVCEDGRRLWRHVWWKVLVNLKEETCL